MSNKRSYFRLEKLYIDCIDESGNCFIIYNANLKISIFRISYSSVIYSSQAGVTFEKTSFKKINNPLISDLLLFYNRFLETKGTWKRSMSPVSPFVFKDSTDNELIWNCHHPKALAEIIFKEQSFKGLGYAETLSLTIKPWDLPIDELRWGRFLSDEYAITWLNWKGSHPLNKLYLNGTEYNDSIIEPDRITFGNGDYVLMFSNITVIKKERLSKTFSGMPILKIFFKSDILNSIEEKIKCKSILYHDLKATAFGWSLYETVEWKR